MHDVNRLLDANANRAREALRVMEDAARFIFDDRTLSAALKSLRHDFAQALGDLGRSVQIELHRDTPNDVGTSITTSGEQDRSSVQHVVVAAGKRLSEALRALEEYGKLVDTTFAATIESIRYRGYAVESELHRCFHRGRQWRVCVLITASLCSRRSWQDVAQAALAGGADCLQLREKDLESGEWLERAIELVEIAADFPDADIIINDRPDIALLSGAKGVHLGQSDLPCATVRRAFGHKLLIGVSTGDLDQANQAVQDGADYCGVGPMFPTTTKHKPVLAGPAYLNEFVKEHARVPHLAIGGIDIDNVFELTKVGCRGIAVSSSVCASAEPDSVVRELVDALNDEEHRHETQTRETA